MVSCQKHLMVFEATEALEMLRCYADACGRRERVQTCHTQIRLYCSSLTLKKLIPKCAKKGLAQNDGKSGSLREAGRDSDGTARAYEVCSQKWDRRLITIRVEEGSERRMSIIMCHVQFLAFRNRHVHARSSTKRVGPRFLQRQ